MKLGEHTRTVLGESTDDWVAKRRAEALDRIVESAWDLARQHGLAGLSLRDLARRLGMAPASLYSYLDSKHGLYDAMFAQGYRALLALGPPRAVMTCVRSCATLLASTSSSRSRIRFAFSCCRSARSPALSRRLRPTPLRRRRTRSCTRPLRAVVEVTQERPRPAHCRHQWPHQPADRQRPRRHPLGPSVGRRRRAGCAATGEQNHQAGPGAGQPN